MKARSWIVVANGDRARIFKVESIGVLKELTTLKGERMHTKNQNTTGNTLGKPSGSLGGHAVIEPKITVAEKEALQFAKTVSSYLEKAKRENEYENIYLAAEPKFLGHLREAFSHLVKSHIVKEIPKDFVSEDSKNIWKHLSLPV